MGESACVVRVAHERRWAAAGSSRAGVSWRRDWRRRRRPAWACTTRWRPRQSPGYYTSETGASKELRYELIPGRFDPDIAVTRQFRALSNDWTGLSIRNAGQN